MQGPSSPKAHMLLTALRNNALIIRLLKACHGAACALSYQSETDYVSLRCSQAHIHPGWSFSTGQNDIALCILPSAVTDIKPVLLASRELDG